jgi:hypothetical protein
MAGPMYPSRRVRFPAPLKPGPKRPDPPPEPQMVGADPKPRPGAGGAAEPS